MAGLPRSRKWDKKKTFRATKILKNILYRIRIRIMIRNYEKLVYILFLPEKIHVCLWILSDSVSKQEYKR